MRLIDADVLFEDCLFSSPELERGLKEFINDAPTIDAVPTDEVEYIIAERCGSAVDVVRCKDCNRAQKVEVFPGVKAQYNIACPLYHNMIFADEHYCAWGERKDDE